MHRKIALILCLLLIPAGVALGQEKGEKTGKAKELSGMSIIGNDEAPKSLYIVPWKSSALGAETTLNRMWSEKAVPVDRDVFKRQLEFYQVRTAQPTALPRAAGDRR